MTLEQQIAALERSHRRTQAAAGVVFAAALALVVVGAPLAMAGLAGDGLQSSGAIVNGAAITPSSITMTSGDINLANSSSSAIRGGASGLIRVDDAIGVYIQYGANNTQTMDATNVEFIHVNGALIATGDTTSPVKAGFRITPQDAQPTGASVVGDMYVTSAGLLKICTVAGTPGTWVSVGTQ